MKTVNIATMNKLNTTIVNKLNIATINTATMNKDQIKSLFNKDNNHQNIINYIESHTEFFKNIIDSSLLSFKQINNNLNTKKILVEKYMGETNELENIISTKITSGNNFINESTNDLVKLEKCKNNMYIFSNLLNQLNNNKEKLNIELEQIKLKINKINTILCNELTLNLMKGINANLKATIKLASDEALKYYSNQYLSKILCETKLTDVNDIKVNQLLININKNKNIKLTDNDITNIELTRNYMINTMLIKYNNNVIKQSINHVCKTIYVI